MIEHPSFESRRPPITPQLAMRVAMLGGIAFVLFAIVFFRLWYLQVLSGDQYVQAANDNRVRELRVQAPRGQIVDRNGELLVDSEQAVVVQLDASKLPSIERKLADRYRLDLNAAIKEAESTPAGRRRARRHPPRVDVPPLPASERELRALYVRLARVLGMSADRIHRTVVEQLYLVPYSNVTLQTAVPRTKFNYLRERQDDFPGVRVERVYLRRYPHEKLAAQLFGTVGEISEGELEQDRYRGVTQGTVVGKGGIEKAYDQYLRGRDGRNRVQVDSLGRPKGELSVVEPIPGKQLKLSVDLGLQGIGHSAMRVAAQLARSNGNPAPAGAFVALDPRNGAVLAMGSEPSFNPNVFSRPLRPEVYKALVDPVGDAPAPLVNRATSPYPTGSTFKIVTALAGLSEGLITPSTVINDGGKIKISNLDFQNAGKVAHGPVELRKALQVSSDVYFYLLGRDANGVSGGNPIVSWARKLGFGRPTGIDIADTSGLVPSRAWRNREFEDYTKCLSRKRKSAYSCAVDNFFVNRPWTVGDSVNLSIGQGDLLATPLQTAVAYAAIANGGRVVRPHLGLEVEDNAGRVLQQIEPSPVRRIKDIRPEWLTAIRDGLRRAASEPGGTSQHVFEGWPHNRYPVYGKTGTAQNTGTYDQSWYAAYVPDPKRPIVIVATVEKGGFGAEAAAPAVRLMLSEWFGVEKKVVTTSDGTTD